MIEIKDVSKSYGTNLVLDKINLSFQKGSVYGIVGENGAGKTTLFKCIAGIENHSGDILYTAGILRNNLGFLPTDPYFFSNITGREYLQLLCNARGLPQQRLNDQNIFDLPLNKYAEAYSTGMKKKLALTALLLQKNDVYVLDEPFNGVDIQSNLLIKQIILRLKELNKIVIISSHIFSTLIENCDYLHLLKNGNVINSVDSTKFSEIEQNMLGLDIKDKLAKLNLH